MYILSLLRNKEQYANYFIMKQKLQDISRDDIHNLVKLHERLTGVVLGDFTSNLVSGNVVLEFSNKDTCVIWKATKGNDEFALKSELYHLVGKEVIQNYYNVPREIRDESYIIRYIASEYDFSIDYCKVYFDVFDMKRNSQSRVTHYGNAFNSGFNTKFNNKNLQVHLLDGRIQWRGGKIQ